MKMALTYTIKFSLGLTPSLLKVNISNIAQKHSKHVTAKTLEMRALCDPSKDQIRSDQIRSDQIRSDQIRSDQIRSDQIRSGVQEKAAEPMKSRFLHRELEIPPCFDKIWVSISWRVTILRKRPNVTVIHWQIRGR